MRSKKIIQISLLIIITIAIGLIFEFNLGTRVLGTNYETQSKISVDSNPFWAFNYYLVDLKEDPSRHYLEVRSYFGPIQRVELNGFEDQVNSVKQIQFSNSIYFFIKAPVGVHSENLAVISFDGTNLKAVQFKDQDSLEVSITCDWPKIEIKEANDSLDIEIYYRDYNKDPLSDGLIKFYHFQDNHFKLNEILEYKEI